ncbi:MAG: tetratricopeptide repeat protein [Blastocatellia bacterium]
MSSRVLLIFLTTVLLSLTGLAQVPAASLTTPPADNTAEDYLRQGSEFFRNGDNDQALAAFSSALRLQPGLVVGYLLRGSVFEARGDYRRAERDYSQAIRLRPDQAYGWSNRSRVLFVTGADERAIADATRAIEISPNDENALLHRALAYERQGFLSSAMVDVRQLLRLNQAHEEARQALDRMQSAVADESPAQNQSASVTETPAENKVSQPDDQNAGVASVAAIPAEHTEPAPQRRGRKGFVSRTTVTETDQPAVVTDKAAAAVTENEKPVTAESESASAASVAGGSLQPEMIRLNADEPGADAAEKTARLRYEYVTSSAPRSRFGFLKVLSPKRLKNLCRSGLHGFKHGLSALLPGTRPRTS